MAHVLLFLIQTLLIHQSVLSQTSICIWGRLGVNSALNGLYTHEGTHNNKWYYRKQATQSCNPLYIYYRSSGWYINRVLGSTSYNAYCKSSSILANCNEWKVYDGSTTSTDSKVTLSIDECPTITSTSLQHYEPINVPYSTSMSSQYFNYTINDLVGAELEQVNIYYLISGSKCHIPRLTLWTWDNDEKCPTIVINDMLFNTYGCLGLSNTNTRYEKCVSYYDLVEFLNGDAISSLHIKLDPMNPNVPSKTKIQLSCWVPSITAMNVMWLNMDQLMPIKQYAHFSLYNIATQKTNINGNHIAVNELFYFITSGSCYNPLLTVNVLDSDYDENDEYLQIDVNGQTISNCYPLTNTCSRYHNCLDSYDLGMTSITNFIHIRTYGMGVDIPCKIDDNTFGFVAINVTLSCYIQTEPTQIATLFPINNPSKYPTHIPTKSISTSTKTPSEFPTNTTSNPTHFYTISPTNNPTFIPSQTSSFISSQTPTILPNTTTSSPTYTPTQLPTVFTTDNPSKSPTNRNVSPTKAPTDYPSISPSLNPTLTSLFVTEKIVDKTFDNSSRPQIILIILITFGALVIVLIFIYVLYRALKRQIVKISQGSNYDKVQSQIDFGNIITPNQLRQQEGKDIELMNIHENNNIDNNVLDNNLQITGTADGGEDMHSLLERQNHIKMWFKNHVKLTESNDKYYNLFILNGYDELSLISEITNIELIEMGVDKLAHRKRILKAVETINTTAVSEQDLNDNEQNLNKKQAEYTCVLCMENQPNTLNLPCGHACYCVDCADNGIQQNKSCPSCRQTITECIQIYNAGFENNSYVE